MEVNHGYIMVVFGYVNTSSSDVADNGSKPYWQSRPLMIPFLFVGGGAIDLFSFWGQDET